MRRLDDRVTVSPQIQAADVQTLADSGVSLIINNRPDGEETGQPSGAEIEAAAQAAGVRYVSAPYQGRPTTEAVVAMQAALDGGDQRIHAFCRSGMRSCAVWAITQVKAGRPVEDIIAAGQEAGYDLAPLFV